jgi:hypothetical protein
VQRHEQPHDDRYADVQISETEVRASLSHR